MIPPAVIEIAKQAWKYKAYLVYAYQIVMYLINKQKIKPMKPTTALAIVRIVELFDAKTKTGVFEPFDGPVLKKLLSVGFNMFAERVDPATLDLVEQFLASLVTTDDTELIAKLTPIINGKVDLPGLDELQESEIIKSLLQTISYAVRGLLT